MSDVKVPYYRLYIDEAGDHTYKDLDYVSHRYLGLLGCIFERKIDYQKAADGLEALKKKFWPHPDPDRPVIFHREDMVNRRGYFSIFRNEDTRKDFDNKLIEYLRNQSFIIINVIAYPLKERLFYEKGIRTNNFKDTFNERVFEAVKDRYNRQIFTGRIKGYGEVFI